MLSLVEAAIQADPHDGIHPLLCAASRFQPGARSASGVEGRPRPLSSGRRNGDLTVTGQFGAVLDTFTTRGAGLCYSGRELGLTAVHGQESHG